MSGSNPGWALGYVPPPSEWNNLWANKYDAPAIGHQPFRPDMPPYNAKFDGSTDDTAAWAAMFADIASRGWGEVILPGGVSKVQGGALAIPTQCKIRGQGMGATVIQRLNSSSTGLLFDLSGTDTNTWKQYCVLEDLCLDGLGSVNGGLLRFVFGNGHFVNRCQFFRTNDFGIQICQLWDSIFTSNRLLNCSQNTSASAYSNGNDADGGTGGQTIGSEALQIVGKIAASGFGSATASSNQLRFHDTLIESFFAGGIAQVTGFGNTTDGVTSHSISFVDTKMETNNLTGRYFIQQTTDVATTRIVRTYCGFQGSAGVNSGAQNLVYFTNSEGSVVEQLVANIGVNGCQSFVKMFSGGGGEINNIKAQQVGTLPKAIIWTRGGTNPNVLGTIISGTPASLPTIYNDAYTAFHSGA